MRMFACFPVDLAANVRAVFASRFRCERRGNKNA
jgi:hypothetical protein